VTVHIVSGTKLSRGRLADGPGKRFLSLKPALQIMSISPPLCGRKSRMPAARISSIAGLGRGLRRPVRLEGLLTAGLGASLLDFKSDVLNNVPVLVRSGAHHPVSAPRAVQVS